MKLNLQTNNQSFVLFDAAMAILALLGLALASLGWWLGGAWLWLSYLMALCLVLLAYGIWIAPKRLKTTHLREALSKSPQAWLKAVYIADLHAGSNKSEAWYKKLCSMIKEIDPELLLVGGDFSVCDASHLDKLQCLAKLDMRHGKYFVLGNHDYLDDPQIVKEQLSAWGFESLTNETKMISFQGLELQLAGLDETLYGAPKISKRITEKPLVALAHEPDALLDLSEGQADLVLCGHTHGGQIRFPLIGCLVVPSKLGRRVDMGRKVINGIPTFITRGLGEVLCRARLLCPPEIVVLELGI
ncbi:MAG: metallophosphoesterase [Patescibacteria group bacterium]|nr:metallophosphoesterase [Patescibacteria group bacterium]